MTSSVNHPSAGVIDQHPIEGDFAASPELEDHLGVEQSFESGLHWGRAYPVEILDGHGLVPLRWVFVADLDGTHRDEYFFTTDSALLPADVIAFYCGRRNIETTFQECRAALGPETTRARCRNTVLRAAPCLFGLYSVVALSFDSLPSARRIVAIRWAGKLAPTFTDALTAVRRRIWEEGVFPSVQAADAMSKLPPNVRELLLSARTLAA